MRRAAFVKANQERWKKFEDLVNNKHNKPDPDQLADLFIQVQDDLSFSNTHFPGTDTTHYLNHLASKIHLTIYKNKRESRKRIVTFWTIEVPMLFYEHRKKLLYSFMIFSLAVLVGALSAANDELFVRLILGDRYVDMTLENIEKGEVMGVYASSSEANMFVGITVNNILVSLRTFAWGWFINGTPLFALLSFGTGFILVFNGIMLGSFQYFFYSYGLLGESALTIWLHGTIEIAAIIMAGTAGLVAGNSILFPGTYKRKDSFQKGAKDGVKIVIGLIPLFIIAGFIESFVTRLFGMPVAMKILIIAGSLAFILFYFIWYPYKVNKKCGP